jgi:hypothetical protein
MRRTESSSGEEVAGTGGVESELAEDEVGGTSAGDAMGDNN